MERDPETMAECQNEMLAASTTVLEGCGALP
jgi:hypothetical protein